MTSSKKWQWAVIFGLLGAFTFITAGSAFARSDESTAYAAVVQEHPQNQILIEANDSEDSSNFLHGFAHLFEHQLVCSINQQQYDALAAHYDLSLQTIVVDGKNVQIASVGGAGLTRRNLESIIDVAGCRALQHAHLFYLVFTGSVS